MRQQLLHNNVPHPTYCSLEISRDAANRSVITLTPADAPVAEAAMCTQPSARSTMLNGSAIMLVAMMLVNVFNFAYNMVMARMLGPAAFGNINAAVTLLLLASCISLAFQLVCAKFVARNHSDSSKAAVVHSLLGKAWIASLALGAVLFLAQKQVATYLNVPSPGSSGCLRWVLRRMHRWRQARRDAGVYAFPRLGTNFVLEAITRFFWEQDWSSPDTAFWSRRCDLGVGHRGLFYPRIPAQLRVEAGTAEPPSYAEAIQAIVFFVGQVIINNVEYSAGQAFFPSDPAGVYAAISPDWAAALFRFVVRRGQRNVPVAAAASPDTKKPTASAYPCCWCLPFSDLHAVAALFPHLIMGVIFGSRFIEIGWLLALYAIATGLYSLSVVFIAYEMSRRIANTGWLQLIFSGALVLGIGFFHQSLHQSSWCGSF